MFTSKQELLEFVNSTDCFVQFDSFGSENSFYYKDNQFFEVPSAAQCIKYISHCKEEKKLDRVLMSHDINTKNKLVLISQFFSSNLT